MSEDNSYETPEDDSVNSPSARASQASLEGAIKGEYDFSIGALIKTAWNETSGFKLTAWGAVLIYGFFSGVISVATYVLDANQTTSLLINILFSIMLIPMGAGLYMLGIHRAAKREVKAIDVFAYYNQMLKIIGLYLLMLALELYPNLVYEEI